MSEVLPRGGLGDITIVDHDADKITAEVVASIEGALGRSFGPADPARLLGLSLAAPVIQTRLLADIGAKQGLLSYAMGENLDHLGYYLGVERPGARSAYCSAVFTRSNVEAAEVVPAGVELSGMGLLWRSDAIYFERGAAQSAPVVVSCVTPGAVGNGAGVGAIATIVTPDTVLSGVANVTASNGGADALGDPEYAELIRSGLDAYSCAGPVAAYEYYAKQADPNVLDVVILSPAPAEVDIYVLLQGGSVPAQDDPALGAVLAACSAETVRPVGDRVRVLPPEVSEYQIDVTYYLERGEAARLGEQALRAQAEAAIADFIAWQGGKIGRDISPSKLTQMLLNSGVKRIEVRAPEFARLESQSVAVCTAEHVEFGGIEDE